MADFDLRDYLTNRAYPQSSIPVLMSEEQAFRLAAVQAEHSANTDTTKQAELDRRLAQAEADCEAAKFIFHIRATSNRAKEDIQSVALHEVPIERDMYSRDKPENEMRRKRVLRELIFAAHITKVVAPGGGEQAWTEDIARDLAKAFLDNAPEHSIELVDIAIGRLSARAELQRAQELDPNTLPES